MKSRKLSFVKIDTLRSDLAEITVDDGIEINLAMVDEIHRYLLSVFDGSFSLLINKTNSYSTQIDALIKFGALPPLDKIAVFAPNKLAKLSADFAAEIPSSAVLNILVFTDRDEALAWL